ncbi:MAG TPA: alkaline phosphatase family protein, partial [Armatimonadota bacterium]|nr:alkaline phosphatase family protein [Armatimonadota bacterium]
KTLFAANRGGAPEPAESRQTAESAGTFVRIDPKTDAALRGSLSIIDTEALAAREIEAGRQPSGMALSADGSRLYVADSDEDAVSILDVPARKVAGRVSVRPEQDPGFGQIPTDVALSADGETLYVACGGANAVAVLSTGRRPRVRGYLPAAWFPIALAEVDGRLVVASSKGVGARQANAAGSFGVHASVGTLQFISPEDRKDLPALTRTVARNNLWGEELPARRGISPVPVPERVGEPSVFKHVVYIIKENHTYDLTLGDMPEGNGDRRLTLFGEEVTPNQHALARQWVLLDNTYTSGTNSADGHQWTDSAVANGYMEQNYGAHSRSYPYDGGDPLAYSPEGFLWNAVAKKGLPLRVYGEFVNRPSIRDREKGERPTWKALWEDYKAGGNRFEILAHTDNAVLRPFLHPNFIGFPTTVSDQWRADQFLADLRAWEQKGEMPSLCMLLLPNDHTVGTRPGYPTPRAQVADNDLATGRIVESLSHSRFWKETLVLVIEDDSQMGLDHVDGHRTIAFCVSPYTRRGAVISEPYNHTSFLRTIELVLGLPAMTRFDRTAQPLRECFTAEPDLRPFTHLPNRVPLDTMNPPATSLRGLSRRLAEASDRLDWSDVDRADAETVARAVWHSVRPGQPFPAHAFHANPDNDD